MNKIAIYLDVDGVLNQYDSNQRIYRKKKHGWGGIMDPFPKKVLRLNKLIKKYNIDVYLFSAWHTEELQPHVPFKIKGELYKLDKLFEIMKVDYDLNILIDDEADHYNVPKDFKIIQPYYEYGLVKKDFRNLERIINGIW